MCQIGMVWLVINGQFILLVFEISQALATDLFSLLLQNRNTKTTRDSFTLISDKKRRYDHLHADIVNHHITGPIVTRECQ